ncbi:MAG: hypothetical protein ABIC95_04645 [archaeon]
MIPTTTISITINLKERLRDLGRTGDTYNDVIEKMYALTRKNLLTAYLYDTSDTMTIDEAKARLKHV